MAGTIQLTGKYAKLAEKILSDAVDILNSENIPYSLEAGTLLGIIRENRLLPWDNDVDITVTDNYAEKLIACQRKFWVLGYSTKIIRFKKDTGPFKKGTIRILKVRTTKFLFFKGVSLLDISVKHRIDEKYFWTVDEKTPVLKSSPRKFYEDLTEYKFKGKFYTIPRDYIGYLEYHYGDWETPKKLGFRSDDTCEKQVR